MVYKVAERFKSVQGEGVYAGTPMAFIRFVGCSVGKTICQHCDTDFDKAMPWRGGGELTAEQLLTWAEPNDHICLTGGEPLDQDLEPLFEQAAGEGKHLMFHIETSGTVPFQIATTKDGSLLLPEGRTWVCVSPKPGFLESSISAADEVKVIVPGLGEINKNIAHHRIQVNGEFTNELKRWPDLSDALRWAAAGKIVFLQPRNGKFDVDKNNLLYVQDLLREHPQLRLSVQLHKILKVQ